MDIEITNECWVQKSNKEYIQKLSFVSFFKSHFQGQNVMISIKNTLETNQNKYLKLDIKLKSLIFISYFDIGNYFVIYSFV